MILLLLLLCFQESSKAEYVRRESDVFRYFWEERLRLADGCIEQGLYADARALLKIMEEEIPRGSPYRTRAVRTLKGSWSRKPDHAEKARGSEFVGKLDAYYRACADRNFSLHEFALKSGLEEQARRSMEGTLRFYFDHPGARAERGEEAIDTFGWVDRDTAGRFRSSCVEMQGADLEALTRQDDAHASWSTSWFVRSEHYILRSDLPIRRIVRCLEELEFLRAMLTECFGSRIAAPAGRFGICLFAKAGDFATQRSLLEGVPQNDAAAFFHSLTRLVYACSGSTGDGQELGTWDLRLLLHEATHQWLDLATQVYVPSVYHCAARRADARRHYWVIEGFASYFGTLRRDGDRASFQADGFSREIVRKAAEGGTLPAFKKFMGFDHRGFLKDPGLHYAYAQTVVKFLMEEGDGRHRGGFLDFLSEFYRGQNAPEAFDKHVAVPLATLEKEFRAFLER